MCGMPDMPVASTRCFAFITCGAPFCVYETVHSCAASSYFAPVTWLEVR